ncbi:MAG: alpha/beta hydrolase [Candidatus Gastranaerophilaceae bacterium]|jgi:esterase/lipase
MVALNNNYFRIKNLNCPISLQKGNQTANTTDSSIPQKPATIKSKLPNYWGRDLVSFGQNNLRLSGHDLKLIQDLQIPNSPEELATLKRGLLFRPNNVSKPIEESLKEKIKNVTVKTADGKELKSWYIPPKEKGGMTILYCHGNASPLAGMQDIAQQIADLNNEFGIGGLMLEYRGYGENKDLGIFKEKKDIYKDVEGGFNFLKNEGTPEKNIVSWGLSLGGVPATEIAAKHNGIRGLILESALGDNNKIFQGHAFLDFLKKTSALSEEEVKLIEKSPNADKIIDFLSKSEFFHYKPVAKMPKTGGIPTLIIHSGKNDIIIPQTMAENFCTLSPNKKSEISPENLKDGAVTELHISEGGNHRFMDKSSQARLRNFLVSLLPAAS